MISVCAATRGAVDAGATGGAQYLGGVGRIHPASGHNIYAARALLHEGVQQWYAVNSPGLLTGGEQSVAPQGNDLLQGVERVSAYVERAVESDVQPAGGVDKTAACINVDSAIGHKSTYHHAIHAGVAALPDIALHHVYLGWQIHEVARAWADKHSHGHRARGYGTLYHTYGGCEPVELKGGAQLNAVGTAAVGFNHAADIGTTDFKYSVHRSMSSITRSVSSEAAGTSTRVVALCVVAFTGVPLRKWRACFSL